MLQRLQDILLLTETPDDIGNHSKEQQDSAQGDEGSLCAGEGRGEKCQQERLPGKGAQVDDYPDVL